MKAIITLIFLLMPSAGFAFVQDFDNSVRDALKWENTEAANTASDYVMWGLVISPTAVALNQDENRWQHLYSSWGAQGAVAGATHIAKVWAARPRPNGNGTESFFSGHTSASFAGAMASCQIDKDYCAPGVVLASLVGYLRIAANRHWFSDVFVGGVVGSAGGRYLPAIIIGF